MSDDKARPVLSLKRKVPASNTTTGTPPDNSENGPAIVVSRRQTLVVNTGPKRNKKALPNDTPVSIHPPRVPGEAPVRKPKPKPKKKKTPAPPPKRVVKVIPPPLKKKPRPGRSPRLMRPVEAVNTLSMYWPGLFSGGRLRPLAVGVREQLFADAANRALPLSHKVIRRCLKTLTRTETYLTSLAAGAVCYNADGSVESIISPEREAAAGLKLARVQADKLKKQAAKAATRTENKE